MIGTSHTLERLLDRAGRLYSLPAVALRVLALTGDPDVDTVALKECIENDPALSAKLLRVVNSSLFAPVNQVSDLHQAIALLGIKPLKLLVLGFSLPEKLFLGVANEVLGRYWRRTLTKAVAARRLSQQIWKLASDDAFIAGLLDELGMLVLIQELGESYVRFLTTAFRDGSDVEELETRVLGFTHRQLSTNLLERWRLPESLVLAMDAAQAPETFGDLPPEERALPQILHLSELLSLIVVDQRTTVLPQLLEAGRVYHELSAAELAVLVSDVERGVAELADVMCLELPANMDYREVLVQAHTRLSAVAAEVACGIAGVPRRFEKPLAEEDLLDEARQLAASLRAFTEYPKPPIVSEPKSPPPAPTVDHVRPAISPNPQDKVDLDPGLLGQLGVTATSCRQLRSPLALLLVEIDNFEHLLITQGPSGVEPLVRLVEAACRSIEHTDASCTQVREARFAVILPDCDRSQAAQLGNKLVRFMRHLEGMRDQHRPAMTISVGAATVALPSRNFCPQDLIDSAERCLFGTQFGGGNGVKSIEI